MGYSLTDNVPKEIESLGQQQPPFDAQAVADPDQNSTLKDYLDFYRLPVPGNRLQLFAGRLFDGDRQTHTMAWRPDEAVGTLFIVHGYLDHTGLYRNLISEFLKRRMAVVCFDLYGHGLSSGEPGNIRSFGEYVHQLEKVIRASAEFCPGPFHGIGQSTGGAVLLKHLIEQPDLADYPFASLNLLAPLAHPRLWRLNRWAFKLTGRFRKSMKRVFRNNTQDPEFRHFLQNVDPFQPRRLPKAWIGAMAAWAEEIDHHPGSSFPINVIQGDADGTLDWQYNIKLFQQKFPNMALQLIPGAGHHMVNEREDLREKVFAAIRL